MNVEVSDSPQKKSRDWVSILVTVLVLAWTVGITVVIQGYVLVSASFPDPIFRAAGISAPLMYIGAAAVQAAALLLPLLPLGLFWRAPRYRALFRTWLVATLYLILLAPARLVPTTLPQLTLLLQVVLTLIFAAALWSVTGRGTWLGHAVPLASAFALGLGFLFALPWLAWGALGSIGDVILGIVCALAFALAATLVITRVWLRGMAQAARGTGWDVTLGGFVIGTALLVMGSASGLTGTQFWLMVTLSALGWLLMELGQIHDSDAIGSNELALFLLIAFAFGAPLLLIDPEAGLALVLFSENNVAPFVAGATGLVVLGAWGIGLITLLFLRRLRQTERARGVSLAAAALGVVGVVVYFTLGNPGFFGDRLFVIMKNQADVSGAKQMGDYNARRQFVYNTLTANANTTQSDLRATLDQFYIPYTPYYLVNGLEVSADLPVRWWLATRSDVDRVLTSSRMRPSGPQSPVSGADPGSPPATPEWNLTMIGADRVWNELGVRGAGVLVGQSDTGVDGSHPELVSQYRGLDGNNNYNWFDPWNHSLAPVDFGGHGTHTLGTILGKHVGVAPDATWIGCVNLARTLGNPALYLDCMQFNFAPFPQNGDPLHDGKPNLGAMVLNNSWGCPPEEGCDAETLLAAVRALRAAGVFVVASAGNDGPACSTISEPLALYDDVFSVGAVDRNKGIADFSSRGPVTSDSSGRIKPDIAAPGVEVLSSYPGKSYESDSGTSMAGPHIVGVVALLWSANPKLIGDIDRTEQIMRETTQPAILSSEKIVCGDPNATPNDFTGYGIVDAYAAVKRALAEK